MAARPGLPLLGIVSLLLLCGRAAAQQPTDKSTGQAPPTAANIIPTLTPTGELPSRTGLRQPGEDDGVLVQRARELDVLIRETAQDLGLEVDLAEQRLRASQATERGLVERASQMGRWQISPRLELDGKMLLVRLVVVPPDSSIALVRVERVSQDELEVQTVVMLRDLIRAGRGQTPRGTPGTATGDGSGELEAEAAERARSPGRAILAVNSAALGGFVGYSLQKSSGSDDERLTYPLIALGTGIAVGGSLLVAEEWDVGVGDAWYLSAGAAWPTLGGLLIAEGHDVQPESDRYAYGLAAGLGGLSLASFALSFRGMSEVGAAVAHSGGALGTGFGAGTELAIRGTTTETPHLGLGYGAIAGSVIGGAIGTQIKGSASRMLMMDVGAALGGVAFAAVASPLLIGDPTEGRERAWVLTTMGGALAGGAVAYWLTDDSDETHALLETWGKPYAGVVGTSVAPDGTRAPAYGLGWTGRF